MAAPSRLSTTPLSPTPAQKLLLQAALLDAPAALDAYVVWQRAAQAGACVDDLEPDSQWLLPQLYCNLRAAGLPEPRLLRFANVYRHNWYKNNLLLRAARPVLEALAHDGSPPLLMGGAALAVAHYPALGARPIERLDLLTPNGDTAGAAEALGALGWQPAEHPPSPDQPMTFSDRFGRILCLRSRFTDPAVGHRMLEAARPVRVSGMPALVLSHFDQLVHLLVNRGHWDSRSALLWVCDAALVICGAPPAALARLEPRARQFGAGQVVVDGLRMLARDYGLSALLAGLLIQERT